LVERRPPAGRSAAFQAAKRWRRQDAGGTAGWKPALRYLFFAFRAAIARTAFAILRSRVSGFFASAIASAYSR